MLQIMLDSLASGSQVLSDIKSLDRTKLDQKSGTDMTLPSSR